MTLNPALTGISLDELRERRSAKWRMYEPDVLPAFVAEMDFPLAAPVSAALREAVDRGDTGYSFPDASGFAEAFAAFAERRFGWAVDPECVKAPPDVVAGLIELLRVMTEPGDRVVINPPVYHPFFEVPGVAGREVAEVPLRGDGSLDTDGIAGAFADGAKALILCHPHNPTGRVLSREELETVASAAAEHGAWVLSDEIHAPMTLPGAEHIPFTSVSGEAAEHGIVLTSASKSFNLAGLSCAVAVAASPRAREVFERLPFLATHPGQFGLIASVAAFTDGDEWLDDVRAVLDHNRSLLTGLLAEHLPGARYEPPGAGYLAWIDCRELGLGDDPSEAFLERGRVALNPGPQFGAEGNGFVRLNLGTSPGLVEEAVRRMARAV